MVPFHYVKGILFFLLIRNNFLNIFHMPSTVPDTLVKCGGRGNYTLNQVTDKSSPQLRVFHRPSGNAKISAPHPFGSEISSHCHLARNRKKQLRPGCQRTGSKRAEAREEAEREAYAPLYVILKDILRLQTLLYIKGEPD